MEQNKKVKKRIIYIDVLNILAMICVVAMHCNGIVHGYSTDRSWTTSLLIEVICFWALPVFLMITGATLMNYRKKYDTKTFFRKRVIKVVVPFVFWATVMIIWKYINGALEIEHFTIKEILNIIFSNGEESTYYFIFLILGVYLTMPVISHLADEKYRNTLWYAVAVLFVTQSVLPVVLEMFGITYNGNLSLLFNGYLIFIFLGYLLSTTEKLNKKYMRIIYCLGIISVIFRYILIYYFSTKNGTLDRRLFGYTQFHSVFLASAVFIFFKNMNFITIEENNKVSNILANMSGCSFGIYLIHKIVIYYEVTLLELSIYSWQWRTIGVITTYIISLCIVYLLKKIPIVKRIVP